MDGEEKRRGVMERERKRERERGEEKGRGARMSGGRGENGPRMLREWFGKERSESRVSESLGRAACVVEMQNQGRNREYREDREVGEVGEDRVRRKR
jgi:hypothetical protein